MRKIKIGKKFLLVDNKDFYLVKDIKWSLHPRSLRGWVPAIQKNVFIHRFILNPPKDKVVDHINHNTLDNRRVNLRICSRLENARNRRMNKNNKSGYKGVYYERTRQKHRAQIGFKGRNIKLGRFKDPKMAAVAYNEAAKYFFGNFAFLNKI